MSLFPSLGVQARPELPPPEEPALSKGKIRLSERTFPKPKFQNPGWEVPPLPRIPLPKPPEHWVPELSPAPRAGSASWEAGSLPGPATAAPKR